jgi:isoleucyl-tRNA synthetase
MLGNLYDFDPANDLVDYGSMPEIDRFALHKLQLIIEKARAAYEAYEFHVIYHSLYNYCTLDLSAFYLDILKDRLYTSAPQSTKRKSAQSVLYYVLEAIARLMAPILPFTSDEIWQYMPTKNSREPNIHLALLPELNPVFKDDALFKRWEFLLKIRNETTKALEEARAKKLIGHPLDAAVTISAKGNVHETLLSYADKLRSLLIVSRATLVKDETLNDSYQSEEIEGLAIQIEPAPGEKCERCWVYDTSVGSHSEQATICDRCRHALAEMG